MALDLALQDFSFRLLNQVTARGQESRAIIIYAITLEGASILELLLLENVQ